MAPFSNRIRVSDLHLQSTNPPKGPTPRQFLKKDSAKILATSVSGTTSAPETADKQTVNRKRPAEGEIINKGGHEVAPVPGHPSKRVKGSANVIQNKPQPLRRTGLFFKLQVAHLTFK